MIIAWLSWNAGRIFPKLRKKLSNSEKSIKVNPPSTDADIDYVFRIVVAYKPKSLRKYQIVYSYSYSY